MKKYIKIILPAIFASLGFAACSDHDTDGDHVNATDNSGKALICFSSEATPMTRLPLTDHGFDEPTQIKMLFKAEHNSSAQVPRWAIATATAAVKNASDGHAALVGEHSDVNYNAGEARYWDDAYGRNTKLTVYAFAIPNKTNAALPEWNVDGWTAVGALGTHWFTGGGNTQVAWSVSTAQNAATMQVEDLTYSNNISEGGQYGRYIQTYTSDWYTTLGHGQLQWNAQEVGSTTGKYDQGHLIFRHALAKLEINLKEGADFNNNSGDDFKWTDGYTTVAQNIQLNGLNTSGTFDASNGSWSGATQTNITQMYESNVTTGTQTTRTVVAYIVPGNNLYETTSNVITFCIDNGQYYVTGQQIANAIREYYTTGAGKDDASKAIYRSFTTTEPGKHYILDLDVSRKRIDRITAAIMDWETVHSTDAEAKNTNCTFSFEDRGTRLIEANAPEFNIYRAEKTHTDFITDTTDPNYDWNTNYASEGAATKTWNGTDYVWRTNWYWPNNKTYYHFRAAGTGISASGDVAITTHNNGTAADDSDDFDYFPISSGTYAAGIYKDYVWGAPFTDVDYTYKINYSESTGFALQEDGSTKQLSKAIAATEDPIKMLLFHMTSQVRVNVTTTTGGDAVKLYDAENETEKRTKVELLNFLPDGRVRMGNGLVETTSTTRTEAATFAYGSYAGGTPPSFNGFSFGVTPQKLKMLTAPVGTVGLRITTPDGSQYYVRDLSTCTATVTTTNLRNPYTEVTAGEPAVGTGKYIIDRWLPNYIYTYTVTLKKTAIIHVTAAVVPWEQVTGDLGTIGLEN